MTRRYSVNVSFDFNINQKSYPAGKYHIKVSKISTDNVALSLADGEKK